MHIEVKGGRCWRPHHFLLFFLPNRLSSSLISRGRGSAEEEEEEEEEEARKLTGMAKRR